MLNLLLLSSLFSARFQVLPSLLWTEDPERASSSLLQSLELISRLVFIELRIKVDMQKLLTRISSEDGLRPFTAKTE